MLVELDRKGIRCGGRLTKWEREQKDKRDKKVDSKEKREMEEWEKDPEAVVFIAHTPGGELRKRLQAEEDQLAKTLGMRKVKFVERGGKSLQSILCVSNPWKKKNIVGGSVLCVIVGTWGFVELNQWFTKYVVLFVKRRENEGCI